MPSFRTEVLTMDERLTLLKRLQALEEITPGVTAIADADLFKDAAQALIEALHVIAYFRTNGYLEGDQSWWERSLDWMVTYFPDTEDVPPDSASDKLIPSERSSLREQVIQDEEHPGLSDRSSQEEEGSS